MQLPGTRLIHRSRTKRLAAGALLISQALFLVSCSLPTRPISPNNRYGQVSVTVQTRIGSDERPEWPLLVIRSILTADEYFLRQQKAATVNSVVYSGRVPPGRYRLLGLVSNPTFAARKIVLSKSLGNFDVLANKECQLGNLLHRPQAQQAVTYSLRPTTQKLCWNQDDQDRQRARRFAERRQTLPPPASLGSGPVFRHSGLLSYRSNRNQAWQVIDSGTTSITAAVELSPNELLIGGEQGLLLYSKDGKQQRLPLQPKNSVVLALTTTKTGVAMLLSTEQSLQLLHTADIHDAAWRVIATTPNGYQKVAAKKIRWSVSDNYFDASTSNGTHLLASQLP